jgi:hypothetical protein
VPVCLIKFTYLYLFGAGFPWAPNYYADLDNNERMLRLKVNVCRRRWVLKQVAEQHQDMAELVEKESVLVKEITEVITYEYLLIQTANGVNLSELMLAIL